MKKTIFPLTLRIATILLALVVVLCSFTSCANLGKTMMSIDHDGIKVSLSVNIYELFLTRMKGLLYNDKYTHNGVGPETQAFWNYTSKFDGETVMTLDEYYNTSIQNNCRTYLVTLYLFEELDLTLSDEAIEDVETRLNDLLLGDGDGSKTKLNSVLSTFGVNYDILKEAYLLEKKVDAVQTELFGENGSLIGDDIKTDHMKENYVHFRQIYLPTFNYKTETDANGDTIYYYPEGTNRDRIYYDTDNGVVGYNENGTLITDGNGDTVYFVNDGNYKTIAYNKANGSPSYLMSKEDETKYQTVDMTDAEKEELKKHAEELATELSGKTYAEFEAAMAKEGGPRDELTEYPDGYYLDRNIDYYSLGEDTAYLGEIVQKLDTMQNRAVAMIPSPLGYHVIMKYDYTEKAYDLESNLDTWFEAFHADLVEKLFLERCETYYYLIKVDEKVMADAPKIRDVAINEYMI